MWTSFKTLPLLTLLPFLSEARKYKLALTVANQFIGQMEDSVRKAVLVM
jgi:hypothetical protein